MPGVGRRGGGDTYKLLLPVSRLGRRSQRRGGGGAWARISMRPDISSRAISACRAPLPAVIARRIVRIRRKISEIMPIGQRKSKRGEQRARCLASRHRGYHAASEVINCVRGGGLER